MAEGYVIGVDLGGTKLLAGAVGADLSVIHRTNRPVYGLSQDELVQMVADAVDEIRTAVGEIEAIGFGIPCTFDSRTGMAVQAVNVPLKDIAFGDVMSERLQMPVVVDNDGNCHAVCESRLGIAQGATDVALLTLGTGIGGGLLLNGEIYRGWIMGGAEMGHMIVDMNGRPCQGNCPNWGCLESVASGTALVREASLAVARQPDTALGHALEEGRELTGPLITELATAGDPVARGAIETIGRALGVGLVNLVNIFNPQVIVIGGGVIAAGELLLAPAREVMLERALAPGKDVVRVEAARMGPEAGMIGAGLLARDVLAGVPTGAIEAPPGERQPRRLPDADREPGGHHAARPRPRCARRTWSPARTRATRRACSSATASARRSISYHEHNERARAAELVERMRDGATVALVSDAGMPLVNDPGYDLVQATIEAGLTVEVLPGPSATITALVASGAAQRRVALRGLPPAQGRPAAGGVHRAGDGRRVRVAPPRRRQPQDPRRARPRAPRRRLPRADEAARGDRPRHGAPSSRRSTRRKTRGARSCWWWAGRRKPEGLDPKAVEAVKLLVDAGARSKTAAKVVSELTGAPSNELYRALLT